MMNILYIISKTLKQIFQKKANALWKPLLIDFRLFSYWLKKASQEHWHPSKDFILKAEGQAGQADTTALISEFL